MMPADSVNLNALCGDEIRHCVIIAPSPNQLPRDLQAVVDQTDAEFLLFDEPLRAFAEVSLQDRLSAKRASWGLQPDGYTCLLLHRPRSWRELPLLMAAVRVYLHRVIVICHDPESEVVWQNADGMPLPVVSTSPRRAAPKATPAMPSRRSSQRTGTAISAPSRPLRLVRSADTVAPRSPQPPVVEHQKSDSSRARDDDDVATPAVSREELAMLLDADDFDDHHEEGKTEASP